MDGMTQHERDNAVVRFTQTHHEDLVDARHLDARPFARGMVFEGSGIEVVTLGRDLKAEFDFRRQFSKFFLTIHLAAFETYARAMIAASDPGVSRTFWYLARYMGRVQEKVYIKHSLDAIRQISIMSQIVELLEAFHDLDKPVIDGANLGAGIAGICISAMFFVSDGLFACVLLGLAVLQMILLLYPIVRHAFLGIMVRKSKKIVDKVLQNAKMGRVTQADIDALDNWKFYFLKFVSPKNLPTFPTIVL